MGCKFYTTVPGCFRHRTYGKLRIKEQVAYAKALADCQAFFPDCSARPRRARRRGARRRVGKCGPVRVVHTQPLVSPTTAYVRPDAIQRRPECTGVWPWAARTVVGAGTPRDDLWHRGGCHRAFDAVRVPLWAEFRPGPVLLAAVYHGSYLASWTDGTAAGAELFPDRDRARGPVPAGSPWARPAPPRAVGFIGGRPGTRWRPGIPDGCPDGVSVATVHRHGCAVCGGECHPRSGRDGGCLAPL